MDEPNWKELKEVLDEEEMEIIGDLYDKLTQLLRKFEDDEEV